MSTTKVVSPRGKRKSSQALDFDHYVALDWSMLTMAVGHLRRRDSDPVVFQRSADLQDFKAYLKTLHGTIVLTLEETTSAHWLYLELRDYVDRIIICDPSRNRLLSDGPKTDKIDAAKLVLLLRAGLLSEVFHSDDTLYDLRLLLSAYTDLIRDGVRAKNQRSALERGHGTASTHAAFILEHLDRRIELYLKSKAAYVEQCEDFCQRLPQLRRLLAVSGIGTIGAVTILGIVVDARRFPRTANYLSYCGLVKLEKSSGGRSYGQRTPRFSRQLKAVYKIAALSAIHGHSPIREYYDHLLAQGVPEHHARHRIARYIATVTYGILKTGTPYDPYRWRNTNSIA